MGIVLKSESIGKLALALSKAQSKIIGAVKDSSNPYYKSKYANLESVMDAIRIPFAENELSYVQPVVVIDSLPYLKTILMHSSGEYIESIYPLSVKDINDAQKVGSSVSYARRYSLAAMAGVPQIDDDAEAAAGRVHEVKEEKKPLPNYAPKATNHIAIEANPKTQLLVTEGQLKRLFAIQQKSTISQDNLITFIKDTYKKSSSKDLTMSEYDYLIQWLETNIQK